MYQIISDFLGLFRLGGTSVRRHIFFCSWSKLKKIMFISQLFFHLILVTISYTQESARVGVGCSCVWVCARWACVWMSNVFRVFKKWRSATRMTGVAAHEPQEWYANKKITYGLFCTRLHEAVYDEWSRGWDVGYILFSILLLTCANERYCGREQRAESISRIPASPALCEGSPSLIKRMDAYPHIRKRMHAYAQYMHIAH